MVLSDRLRRFAAARPHLLLVDAPGGAAARLAVERFTREQGWPLVDTPADADLLVLAGSADGFPDHIGRVWEQLPGPRALVRLGGADDVPAALASAQDGLTDRDAHRRDIRRTQRPTASEPAAQGGHDMSGGGHDMGGGGHDMGHGGHDMGGMQMPAGLAMADRAPDRDGLQLDVLTVPWGPVLPWWPAGVVLTTVLQGDVVQQATVEQLGTPAQRAAGWAAALADLPAPAAAAVVRLDALVRLLAVAGWDGARLRCQHVRDAVLADPEDAPAAARLRALAARVSGSRSLARMTGGLATTQDEDVTARYRRWLAEAVAAVTTGDLPPPAADRHAIHQLPALLAGTDVAGLRLVMASIDPALSGAGSQAAAGV